MIPDRNARGEAPPREWFAPGARVPAAEYRAWLEGSATAKKTSKFRTQGGWFADLDAHRKSILEADTERLLVFLAYQRWTAKTDPPADGLYYRYEGMEYRLTTRQGNTTHYKPDFHLWDHGVHTLWESKGLMDQRSKQRLTLMAKQYPQVPITLITREELDARMTEALYKARRTGPMVLEIPCWGKPGVPKPSTNAQLPKG